MTSANMTSMISSKANRFTESRCLKPSLMIASVLLLGSTLSGCISGTQLTPAEQEMLQTMDASQYQMRTSEEREAIETQPLFAQAAFWSREYDLNPTDLEAAIKLSSTLRRLGNAQKAAEIAQTTRAIYPRDTDLIAEYAANLIALEQGKNAIAPLSSAVRQETNNPRLWSLLGAAHDQISEYGQAREYYNRALRLSPNDSNILANVGLSFALEGDARTAEVWLRRAASDPQASANIRQNLAIVLGLQGKYDEAELLARQDLAAEGAENNLAYLRSLGGGQRSYEALAEPSTTPPLDPAPSYNPTTQQRHIPVAQAPRTIPANMRQMTPHQRTSIPNAPATTQPLNAPRTYGSTAQPRIYGQAPAALPISTPHNTAPKTYGQTQMQRAPNAQLQSQNQQANQTTHQHTAIKSAQNRSNTSAPQGDILSQISKSVAAKTAPQSQLSYRQMEDAYRAQQHSQAQIHNQMSYPVTPSQHPYGQGQYQAQVQAQYHAHMLAQNQVQNQAQTQPQSYAQIEPRGYPQSRPALRARN